MKDTPAISSKCSHTQAPTAGHSCSRTLIVHRRIVVTPMGLEYEPIFQFVDRGHVVPNNRQLRDLHGERKHFRRFGKHVRPHKEFRLPSKIRTRGLSRRSGLGGYNIRSIECGFRTTNSRVEKTVPEGLTQVTAADGETPINSANSVFVRTARSRSMLRRETRPRF